MSDLSRPYSHNYKTILFGVIGSLLLSAWFVYIDPVVNNDGIRYIRAANKLLDAQWQEAITIHHWPFYSSLIALTSKLTGLQAEGSAHVLNATLYALCVAAFIIAVVELGGDRRTAFIATLVILLLPGLNKYRSFVIRDAGYLAFYMWSLIFLFRFWRTAEPRSLVAWFSCAFTAFLFRVEGLAFLLVVPALLLAHRYHKEPIYVRLVVLVALVFVGVALFAVFSLWMLGSELGMDKTTLFLSPLVSISQSLERVGVELWYKLNAIRQEFLGEFSDQYAYAVFVLTLFTIIVSEVVRKLVIVYAGLFIHAVWKRLAFPNRALIRLWVALIAINILILCVFTLAKLFLPGRYTMGLVLTMMLAIPFSLTYLYSQWVDRKAVGTVLRWGFPVIVILCVGVGIKGLDRYTDKQYLREAGQWIAAHTLPDDSLYSNNRLLIYYSGKSAFRDGAKYDWAETMRLVWRREWKNFDYLALQVSRKRPDQKNRLTNKLGTAPIEVFRNRKGDQVLIYKTSSLSDLGCNDCVGLPVWPLRHHPGFSVQ